MIAGHGEDVFQGSREDSGVYSPFPEEENRDGHLSGKGFKLKKFHLSLNRGKGGATIELQYRLNTEMGHAT